MSLPTLYQQYIHLSKYARWRDDVQRRETWEETPDRYFSFFANHLKNNYDLDVDHDLIRELYSSVHDLEVLPSMRCLMTAGKALERDHVAGYNCAYRAITDIRAFDEILYILMCATGVGFSVERQYINQLPPVPEKVEPSTIVIKVRDSKIGWAEALRELIGLLYAGRIPDWDTSALRPKGSILKTMGGRSSGPEPLIELFKFAVATFKNAQGRKLTSLECHDLVCKIGECVVVGGVRRSALISLSNLSDHRMRDAKAGEWWELHPHRALANNSVAFTEKPEVGQFMEEWLSLYKSKSGERGFFNREAARKQAMKNGIRKGYWDDDTPIDFGTNPCSEILLRNKGFCNLSTVVVRPDDDIHSLEQKVIKAAILGTWQSTLTDFRFLTRGWKENCDEERLLGVSMTGIMDNKLLAGAKGGKELEEALQHLRDVVRQTNKTWAEELGISPSVGLTCVKPEGTASQLVDASAGIHARWAPHYIRRVRQDLKDPLTQFMMEQGVPYEKDSMNDENVVFEFPIKSKESAVFRNDRSAIDQLKHWKVFQDNWCDHKPSCTIYVKEHEWPETGSWVWNNFDSLSGIAFLPHSEHNYRQAPYEDINREEYEQRAAAMPEIDWDGLWSFETEDNTKASHELACTGGACDIE